MFFACNGDHRVIVQHRRKSGRAVFMRHDAVILADGDQEQHLVSLGAGIGVIIFLLAAIIVVPYTIYAFRKWFE